MNKKIYIPACLIAIIILLLSHQTALAHEFITVGDYEIEIGWVSEPPVAGQLNGFEISVANISSGEAQPVEDISSLVAPFPMAARAGNLPLNRWVKMHPGNSRLACFPLWPGNTPSPSAVNWVTLLSMHMWSLRK